jgi:hypothetical protein
MQVMARIQLPPERRLASDGVRRHAWFLVPSRSLCTGSAVALEAARLLAQPDGPFQKGASDPASCRRARCTRCSAARAGALVRLDEGAQRGVDAGLVAGPLPLEPGQQIGIEAQPDLLAQRVGIRGVACLYQSRGMSAQSGSLAIAASSSASDMASTRAQSVRSSPRAIIARNSSAV